MRQFVAAHRELTEWIVQHPDEAQRMIREELRLGFRAEMPPELVARAWGRMTVTADVSLPAFQSFMTQCAASRISAFRPRSLTPDRDSLMHEQAARAAAEKAKLVVEGVSKWFVTPRAKVHALDRIGFQVAEGEVVCLVGPSGCGKTTLLDIMAGLTKPDEGRVLADGRLVEGPGRQRLVMFQESALFPWLDAFGNVMFGLKLRPDLTNRERRDIAHDFLKLVGLEKFAHAHVHELSGGMKQRIALARALAPDPQVLLMDEPFAALDATTREQLYDDVQRICRDTRKTIVLVTHDAREAVCLGDRVILMSPSPAASARSSTYRYPAREISTAPSWRPTRAALPLRSGKRPAARSRHEAHSHDLDLFPGARLRLGIGGLERPLVAGAVAVAAQCR